MIHTVKSQIQALDILKHTVEDLYQRIEDLHSVGLLFGGLVFGWHFVLVPSHQVFRIYRKDISLGQNHLYFIGLKFVEQSFRRTKCSTPNQYFDNFVRRIILSDVILSKPFVWRNQCFCSIFDKNNKDAT